MRLLNTETVTLHEFFEGRIPKYAILSHVWGSDEITFKDLVKRRNREAAGWRKVNNFCAFARKIGWEWAWVDTCCIDKRSSAELSEAINSMYKWYGNPDCECFAYLSDIQCEPVDIHSYESLRDDQFEEHQGLFNKNELSHDREFASRHCRLGLAYALRASKWFTRGWTLQELVAPEQVYFLDSSWRPFGSKTTLNRLVSEITGIDDVAFVAPQRQSIATRMSWASKRECTRLEDIAYSLMGLFEVNMPLLYGEGGTNAFERLQLEILKLSSDETIFAWNPLNRFKMGMLAPSPKHFLEGSNVWPFKPNIPREPYAMTNRGLEITGVLLTSSEEKTLTYMPLNCYKHGHDYPLAVCLRYLGNGRYERNNGFGSLDFFSTPDVKLWDSHAPQKIYVDNRLEQIYYPENSVVRSLRTLMDGYMSPQKNAN